MDGSIRIVSKHLGNLFQSVAGCFGKEEVNDDALTEIDTTIDDVIFPRDGIHGNWIYKPVVNQHDLIDKLHNVDTLGSVTVWQDLRDVQEWQTIDTNVIRTVVEENHCQDTIGIRVVLEVLLLVNRRQGGPDNIGDTHGSGRK